MYADCSIGMKFIHFIYFNLIRTIKISSNRKAQPESTLCLTLQQIQLRNFSPYGFFLSQIEESEGTEITQLISVDEALLSLIQSSGDGQEAVVCFTFDINMRVVSKIHLFKIPHLDEGPNL